MGPPTQYHGRSLDGRAPFKYSKVVSGGIPPSVHPIVAPNTGELGSETQEEIMEMLRASRMGEMQKPKAESSGATRHQQHLAKAKADKAKAKAKKAKARECVHLPPSMMGSGGPAGPTPAERDVSHFPELSRPNSKGENGEWVLDYSTQDAFSVHDIFPSASPRINPEHPRSAFYRDLLRLMDNVENLSLEPDLSNFASNLQALDQLEKVDWSGSENGSDTEPDDVDEDIATAAGIGCLSLTPAPAMSIKAGGKQRTSPDDDEQMGPDEIDNNPSSYAYDDYGYHRSVLLHSRNKSTKDEKQQLLIACSSLASRIEFINSFAVNCAKCKTNSKTKKTIEILADSGASASFTMNKSDLTEFEQITDDDLIVKTAANDNTLMIKGKGALFITHTVVSGGKSQTKTSRLYPVYYIPGLSIR